MFKHLRNILVFGTLVLLLAACTTPTAVSTAVPTQTVAITSTTIVIVVTATPMPATATLKPSATLAPTNTPTPAKTNTPTIPGAYDKAGTPITSKSSIIITNIKLTGADQAQITWNATGTFAGGFRIFYSSSFANPFLGGGYSEYAISDGLTRSAYITGVPGTTYYYRICSITNSACDFYSNSFTFNFSAPTSTP